MKNMKTILKGALALAMVALTTNTWAGQAITFTATSASKVYDGTALGPAGCTITAGGVMQHKIWAVYKWLYKDDVVDYDSASYSVDGVTDAGVHPYKVTSIKIKSYWGTDVTSDYDITYADGGTLTITPATITSMTLNEPTTLSYTGKDQTVTVGEVKAGNLTLSASDYDITGNTASEVGVHTVTVTGKGNYQGTATATWEIKAHTHKWSYATSTEGNVVTLTATCVNPDCTLPAPYQTSATLTLSSGDKAYDGQAITAELAKGDFETLTGIALGAVECTGNATDVGTYKFSVSAEGTGCDFGKSVTISQCDIAGKTLTLTPSSTAYTGAGQTVSVTVDGLTKDVDYTISGDALTQVGSGSANKTYTVTVNGIGNYTGTKSAQWTIIAPTGSLGSMAAVGNGCSKDGDTAVKVTASQSLTYDATAKTWSFGLNVAVPYNIPWTSAPTVTYPDNMIITTSCDKVTTSMETDTDSYWGSGYTYVKSVSATAKFTVDDILAAEAAGELKFTVSIGAKAGEYNSAGLKEVIYELVVPIDENLILLDEDKNQVYPALDYVAQVADTKLKYTTLGSALGAATAGQTVNAIAACEAGTFEVGANVTVNLAGFGNAEAAYKFVNVTDEAMSAKVVSTKQENVTTEVTGFAVQNDNYTYTLYRAHQHLWEAATSGATLTATCTNMTTDCDIDGRQTSITLTVTDNGDGNAPTFTIDNKDDFLSKVNKFGEVALIGTATAVRTTDDGAETTKWYIGNYTASCIVTVNGEEKTITQDFQIGGEYKAGGYVVASRSIRYGSFEEALAAATEGDTVYYRNGNMESQSVSFEVTKDITLDFNNAEFYYRGDDTASFSNTGSGTLTLKNIQLKQPRYSPTVGSRRYHDITLGGKLILSDGVKGVETDGDEEDLLAFNVVNATVEVQAGLYQASFATNNNGSVSITGGEFWSYYNPANSGFVAGGYVTVAATTEGYAYKVVPHEHSFYYVTDGNVITLRCQGAGYEGCDWTLNDNYLTLTAEDAFEGAMYAGAKYEITGNSFLYDEEPVIEYYQDGKKIATPSECGSYEARVTVTINEHGATATAVKAFAIKHIHQFKYDIASAATLTATCTNEISDCDVPNRSTAITLSVTPNGDGVAPTFEIANKDAFLGFVNRDATVATIGEITTVRNTDDGAAATKWYVGNYTSTCIVTISGVEYTLTTDFSIAKTAEYTSGWTVGSRDIRYGSWAEARTAAADGDTIYYRDGNRDNTEHDYSVDKNLTIDFSGATLKQTEEESWFTADDMVIKNGGTGTLILQNVTIQQPRTTYSGHIETEGNIVFGDGVKVENTASDSANYCTITVNSGALIVSNGLYQCGFATKSENETVNLRAGKYWEHDKPAIGQYSLADRACIEIEGDYKYEIVPHVHSFIYSAAGNVITSVCDGEYKEGCYWYQNPQTATLTANDAAESTEPYSGASVAYTDLWVGSKELAITYWQGETQLEGAPTRFGSYTAKITVGGATAEKSFTITPMAVTITVQNATNATVKVYEGDTEVTSQTEEYSVTHGNKVTAIYTADEGYTPAAVTNVIESAENGDTIVAPIFKKAGPTIVPPAGSDPETDPEIKPVEGTNGVYVIEVKTNTTTAVMIAGLGEDDTVIVPPQINAVNGANADQVKVVADATNGTATVKVDITPAFTITGDDGNALIELNSNAVVTVEIEGKEPEQVPVTPVLTETADAVKPLVVSDEKIAAGVKTIPGLKYSLLSGDAPDKIETVVKTIVAEDTRVVLEAAKGADPSKFYKIQVAK